MWPSMSTTSILVFQFQDESLCMSCVCSSEMDVCTEMIRAWDAGWCGGQRGMASAGHAHLPPFDLMRMKKRWASLGSSKRWANVWPLAEWTAAGDTRMWKVVPTCHAIALCRSPQTLSQLLHSRYYLGEPNVFTYRRGKTLTQHCPRSRDNKAFPLHSWPFKTQP